MKLLKKGRGYNSYGDGHARKASCVGCYCDSKQCSPSCPKVLK